jgi:hypothetical protein
MLHFPKYNVRDQSTKSMKQETDRAGQENIFLILAAKSVNKISLCQSNIKRQISENVWCPAHCDKLQSRHKTISTCKTRL